MAEAVLHLVLPQGRHDFDDGHRIPDRTPDVRPGVVVHPPPAPRPPVAPYRPGHAARRPGRTRPACPPGVPGAEADGGRGLFLVRHYAYAWGGHPVGDGKLLWFELAAARPADGWAVAA
ncbi:ATP-binding protein [Streptomyces sp. CC224B]|uniref:ATP-binding protein n=1 Tax=Streptomyces sp. CC224B TaxID=3044571 RepID=UPI0032BFA5CB